MVVVEIYTMPFCGYCRRAKDLLQKKGVSFNEIDVMMTPGARKEMMARADGARTVPQVFIDGELAGDSEELARLDREGRLDAMLGLASKPPA